MNKPSQESATKFNSYDKIVIVLLALTQFTVVLDFMVMSPLGDFLMKSMHLTTSQFGWAVSAYAFSAGISGLLTAGFADKFDRKKLLLFFYIGFIGGTLLCGIAHTYYMLLAARIITGLFGGVIGSIAMAIIADLFALNQRGRVMGFIQMGFGASQVLGIPIGLYLANHWGWQSPFLMIVGLSVLIWVVVLVKMLPVDKHLAMQKSSTALKHLWNTLAKRQYRIGFLTTALLSIGGFMMMPWSSAFAVNNLHVTPKELPLLFMVAGLSTLLIMPLLGRISDKKDKFAIFTSAAVWMTITVLIYTNLTPVPFGFIMLMNVMMMIGIMGRIVPAMALVSALPQMHDRGAFMSINSSLQQIAGGIAAAVGGLIVTQKDNFSPIEHYNTLGLVIIGITAISVWMIYRVSQLIKTRNIKEEPVIIPEV